MQEHFQWKGFVKSKVCRYHVQYFFESYDSLFLTVFASPSYEYIPCSPLCTLCTVYVDFNCLQSWAFQFEL